MISSILAQMRQEDCCQCLLVKSHMGQSLKSGLALLNSAWILSTMAPNVQFVSVDHAKEKIDATAQTLRHQQAEFLVGDWKEVVVKGPF